MIPCRELVLRLKVAVYRSAMPVYVIEIIFYIRIYPQSKCTIQGKFDSERMN